jgi:fumarylacetoacetase
VNALPQHAALPVSSVKLHLPISIGDFTDFSCSHDHVLNASQVVFGRRETPPGFLHFPVGYTGRTSSIIVSGTPIVRPHGQFLNTEQPAKVIYGPTKRLDYELEVAAVIGKRSSQGESVLIGDADEYIFGVVLLNDWSGMNQLPAQLAIKLTGS